MPRVRLVSMILSLSRPRFGVSFCLNYFCPSLRTQLGPTLMDTLLAVVGQELAAGWELETALYRWFEERA